MVLATVTFLRLKSCRTLYGMNPLVITGILAVVLVSSAMMVSFSGKQLEYSNTSEELSSMQVQRVQEELQVTVHNDGQLKLANTGPVPVRVVEVRMLDNDGNIVTRQKTDITISSSDEDLIRLNLNDAQLREILNKNYSDAEG